MSQRTGLKRSRLAARQVAHRVQLDWVFEPPSTLCVQPQVRPPADDRFRYLEIVHEGKGRIRLRVKK